MAPNASTPRAPHVVSILDSYSTTWHASLDNDRNKRADDSVE